MINVCNFRPNQFGDQINPLCGMTRGRGKAVESKVGPIYLETTLFET